jgi:hypothetical protein
VEIMKYTDCNQIRLEIDEAELGATLSSVAAQHLRECTRCQNFHDEQTKLRQIVGSLETVQAPADFDFRLRARLANSDPATYRFLSSFALLRSPAFAAVTMLLMIAGGFVFLRQFTPKKERTVAVNEVTNPTPAPAAARNEQPSNEQPSKEQLPAKSEGQPSQSLRAGVEPRRGTKIPRKRSASVDFSNTSATVIRNTGAGTYTATFPLDVSQQSFKVSIDDGRGSSRTISVPTVSFGSRRVLPNGSPSNQFVASGVW